MGKSEDKELQEAKKEHDKAVALLKTRLTRGAFFTGCIANLAVGAYLGILVDGFGINGAADIGQSVLAGISITTAAYLAYKTIE